MSAEYVYIDASDAPALLKLVRSVQDSQRKHVIPLGGEEVAVLTPVRPRRKDRTITPTDREALLSSLGGWADVDTDRLIANIYADRRAGDRPPMEL
jgi:hypothetical protein